MSWCVARLYCCLCKGHQQEADEQPVEFGLVMASIPVKPHVLWEYLTGMLDASHRKEKRRCESPPHAASCSAQGPARLRIFELACRAEISKSLVKSNRRGA